MFRNAGLVLRSLALCFALGSVFACAAEDTGEEQGETGSDLSKGKHSKADASADDGGTSWTDGGDYVPDGGCREVDGGCYEPDSGVDGGVYEDGGAYEDGGDEENDGGVEDGGTAW